MSRGDLAAAVGAAVAGGVDWVQVREKDLDGAALLELTESLARVARGAAGDRLVRVIVNRRCDVALAAAADGVHLGWDGLSPSSARRALGPGAEIGISAHAPDEVANAVDASYAHLAPIFDPRSKPASRPPLGLAGVRAIAKGRLPVLAQGGVDAGNAAALCAGGAAGIAVTGAILMADDPGRAAAGLRNALDAVAPEEPAP